MSDVNWFNDKRHETCSHCHGRGTIARSGPLVACPSDLPVPDAPPNAIQAWVVGSSTIFECCNEAALIARRSGRPVAFEFIDRTVVLRPGDSGEMAARAWWQLTYKETPEQTWAMR